MIKWLALIWFRFSYWTLRTEFSTQIQRYKPLNKYYRLISNAFNAQHTIIVARQTSSNIQLTWNFYFIIIQKQLAGHGPSEISSKL